MKKLRRLIDGHFKIGNVTVYGFNAMHLAIQVSTRWGHVCFHPGWGLWPWYFYISPNATPWASTFARGPGVERHQILLAPVRRAIFGPNFDTDLMKSYEPYVEIAEHAETVAFKMDRQITGGLKMRKGACT